LLKEGNDRAAFSLLQGTDEKKKQELCIQSIERLKYIQSPMGSETESSDLSCVERILYACRTWSLLCPSSSSSTTAFATSISGAGTKTLADTFSGLSLRIRGLFSATDQKMREVDKTGVCKSKMKSRAEKKFKKLYKRNIPMGNVA
jgi:hypothetical protein